MKHLLLMRHAKSDWSNTQITDHERPLNKRGQRDALLMAQNIKARGILPDLMLVSDAQRTRETWQIISVHLGNPQTKFDNTFYMASPTTIIRQLKMVDNLVDTVLLLAHNPGITEVFYDLANIHIDNVPTAGVGCLKLYTDKFGEIENCTKDLVYFSYPKNLI